VVAVVVLAIVVCSFRRERASAHSFPKEPPDEAEMQETQVDDNAFARTLQSMVQLDPLGGREHPFMVSDGFSSDGDTK
jgi:hypothetical protein